MTIRLAMMMIAVALAAGCVRLSSPSITAPTSATMASSTPLGTPTPTPSAALGLPTPPSSFDLGGLRWIGSPNGGGNFGGGIWTDGVWVGWADGTGSVVTRAPGREGTTVGDRVFYFTQEPRPGEQGSALWLIEGSIPPRVLDFGSWYGIAASADFAAIARLDSDGRDAGVWAVPFDGSAAEMLLPRGDIRRERIAASDDGRRVASGRCRELAEGAGLIELYVDGAVTQSPAVGVPLGFSAEGELIYWKGCGHADVGLIDTSGSTMTLVQADYSEARVTHDGRHLITLERSQGRAELTVRVISLMDHAEWSFDLNGDWFLTPLGDLDYAVLQGIPAGEPPVLRPLVVSLAEQWWGVLPTIKAEP